MTNDDETHKLDVRLTILETQNREREKTETKREKWNLMLSGGVFAALAKAVFDYFNGR